MPARERLGWFQIAELWQRKLFLMMAQVAIVTEQDKVVGNIWPAFALRHDMMIFKAAMIVLLRLWSATTQAAFQSVAKINLKTGAVGKRHMPEEEVLRILVLSTQTCALNSDVSTAFCASSAAPTVASNCGLLMRHEATGQ